LGPAFFSKVNILGGASNRLSVLFSDGGMAGLWTVNGFSGLKKVLWDGFWLGR